jgi:hypothetical protein
LKSLEWNPSIKAIIVAACYYEDGVLILVLKLYYLLLNKTALFRVDLVKAVKAQYESSIAQPLQEQRSTYATFRF